MGLQNMTYGHRVHRSWLVRDHRHVVSDHENELVAEPQIQGRRNCLFRSRCVFCTALSMVAKIDPAVPGGELPLALRNVLTVVSARVRMSLETCSIKLLPDIFTK
jgi:hypothetical protein